jgi:uroporphyrin-3 C-methyltransferase
LFLLWWRRPIKKTPEDEPPNLVSNKEAKETKEVDLLAEETVSEPPKPTQPYSSGGSSDGDASNHAQPKKRSVLLPLITLAALGVLGGIWYKTTTQIRHIEKSLAETNQKALLGITEQDKVLDQSYRQLAAQVEATQKKVADMGSQQQEIQSTLSRITGHKEDNWLLAEALYLSRLAVERLQTTQDVKTAIVQLTAADDRLRQVADPSLMPVRKILVDKISELKAVNAPDFEGLWLQLGTISDMAEKLVPIKPDKNKPIEEVAVYTTGWKAALKQSWLEIKSLVKVRSPQENASTPDFCRQDLI